MKSVLADHRFSLKTRLLVMMLSLLILSISSLFLLHLYYEQRLLSRIHEYTDELAAAIEIAQQQPGTAENPGEALDAYSEQLRRLGVKDVSITDASEEVQASTNPEIVGKRLVRRKKAGPREFVIRGVLGEESGPPGSSRVSTLTLPIVVGDRRVGYLIVTRILDDFSALSKQALIGRLAATISVFGLGFLLALYLSWSLSKPLALLTEAARRVSSGDLSVRVAGRSSGELQALASTFNEMVEKLREQKNLEERLHFAERTTALGRLASALAHEIRNPLNFMNLSIDHLRRRLASGPGSSPAETDRVLGSVKEEIIRLNRLVTNFLSVGKPVTMDFRPTNFRDLLREIAALVGPKAADQGVTIESLVDIAIPAAEADAELLKTCLLNLVINAMDAMPDGGKLTMRARSTIAVGSSSIVIEIEDTGRGMSAEALDRAFEPYYSTKDTGLGLGLALTRKIVVDHGGSITLESRPGSGTRATLTLPCKTACGMTAAEVRSA